MGITSSRIFPQTISTDIFANNKRIIKIRSTEIREYLSHPILNTKDTKSFYTLEQLMTLSNDEMKDLCKTRGIEDVNEIAILDWQIENLFNKVRFKNSQCKTDEMSLEFYTYEDINKFLRYIFGLPEKFYYSFIGGYNINILHCIYKLDNMIMNGRRGDINKYYYRGLSKYELFIVEHCIKSREEYKKVIYKGKECLLPSFNEYGFSSVSTSRTVASRFTGYNCCLLKFKLLKDIQCVDVVNTTEKETILQRNLVYYDFKKIDDFKGKLMFECKIRRNPILLDDFYNEKIGKKLYDFFRKGL